jgi:hypothetical protein
MAPATAQRRAGAHYQKLAQVAVAHLCDAPEPRFAACFVLDKLAVSPSRNPKEWAATAYPIAASGLAFARGP